MPIKMWKKFTEQMNKLDEILDSKGCFSKTDLWSLDISDFTKKLIVFVFKRSSNFNFHYILDNVKYDSIYDIEKEQRQRAELFFVRRD